MSHLGDRITALVDQKLDPASREQVLRHLLGCPDCRAEADRERSVRRALSLLGDGDHQPPAPLQARLLAMPQTADVWQKERASVWPPARAPRSRGKSRYFVAGSLSLSAATAAMAFVVGGQPAGPALAPPIDTYTREHAAVGGSVPLTDHGARTVTTLTRSSRP
ncbi:MAG: hypothetical protein GEV07_26800 [Streptosporangiales bacterium]|nr:hypothetical protein [Streptosporangiales bacterium]